MTKPKCSIPKRNTLNKLSNTFLNANPLMSMKKPHFSPSVTILSTTFTTQSTSSSKIVSPWQSTGPKTSQKPASFTNTFKATPNCQPRSHSHASSWSSACKKQHERGSNSYPNHPSPKSPFRRNWMWPRVQSKKRTFGWWWVNGNSCRSMRRSLGILRGWRVCLSWRKRLIFWGSRITGRWRTKLRRLRMRLRSCRRRIRGWLNCTGKCWQKYKTSSRCW